MVGTAGFDRLALAHPCARSAGGRGACRGHPWPLFLLFVGGALGSNPGYRLEKKLVGTAGFEPAALCSQIPSSRNRLTRQK